MLPVRQRGDRRKALRILWRSRPVLLRRYLQFRCHYLRTSCSSIQEMIPSNLARFSRASVSYCLWKDSLQVYPCFISFAWRLSFLKSFAFWSWFTLMFHIRMAIWHSQLRIHYSRDFHWSDISLSRILWLLQSDQNLLIWQSILLQMNMMLQSVQQYPFVRKHHHCICFE